MANRKLLKPTRCLSSAKSNPSQPLINFGFLFKRELHPSPLASSTSCHDCENLNNVSSKPSSSLSHEKLSSDSPNAPPLIQFTALMSCAELIQSSIKDKKQIPTFFPYFNLLQKYKSGRSSSLSPVETTEGFTTESLAIHSSSQPAKNSTEQSLAGNFNGYTKSRRSSSVTAMSHNSIYKEKQLILLNKEKNQTSASGENSMQHENPTDFSQLQTTSEVDSKLSAISSESDHDDSNNPHLNASKFLKRKSANKKKRCASCKAHKTPYWRDGWEKGILLCNACGIRYQKYKKYCLKCHSIARKDDKGRLHCPECNDKL